MECSGAANDASWLLDIPAAGIGLTKGLLTAAGHNTIEAVGSMTLSRVGVQISDDKLGYLFGQTSGRAHNLARSNQNALQMGRLGVLNDEAASGSNNIIRTFSTKYGNFEVRISFFIGPSGRGAAFESTWKITEEGSRRFITAIPYGG